MNPKNHPRAQDENANEGEGGVTAARRYDEGVERSIARGDTDELAKEAQRALEGPEAEELARAEAAAKKPQESAAKHRDPSKKSPRKSAR